MDTYITTVDREGADAETVQLLEDMAASPMIEVMRALQRRDGHLSETALRALAADRLVSLSRLYSVATAYDELVLEPACAVLPASDPVGLPDMLNFKEETVAGLVQGGPITSRFGSPPGSVDEYRASGGMKGWERAKDDLGPEKVFSEIVLGEVTRQAAAWQAAASAEGEIVIIANCHGGDPASRQEDELLKRDPYAIIEGIMIAALGTGASRAFIYTRPLGDERKEQLEGIVAAMLAAAGSDIGIEVIAGPDSLVASESSVAVAVIDSRRPVPSAKDHAADGVWGKPTIVDTGECFAAISAVIARGEQVNTRLYQVTGAVEKSGIIEGEASMSVRDLMEVAGAQPGSEALVGGLSGRFLTEGEVDQLMLHLKPAIGPRWRLIHVLDDARDIYPMTVQIAAFNARYLCGACIPCRIGMVRMAEIIPDYLSGFDVLEELSAAVEQTGLCLTGRGAAATISSALRYVS